MVHTGPLILDERPTSQCVLSCASLQKADCGHCRERIWGLGRQGYKCINCKLLVHKRCHRLIPQTCQRLMVSISSCPEQQTAQYQPAMSIANTVSQHTGRLELTWLHSLSTGVFCDNGTSLTLLFYFYCICSSESGLLPSTFTQYKEFVFHWFH